MWSSRRSAAEERRRLTIAIVTGAAAGLAIGMLLSGRGAQRRGQSLGSELRSRVQRAAARIAPERRVRTLTEEAELSRLEDDVISAFMEHDILSERGIEVGAISRGIVELTGSVWSEDEADQAVRVANGVSGVQTVVNRLLVESEAIQLEANRRRFEDGDPALRETRWEGRRVGMGRTRQSRVTEPDRRDDSQRQVERALEQADRDQWQEEGLAARRSRLSESTEDTDRGNAPDYDEDELDHQDPYAAGHDPNMVGDQPQDARGRRRVGEGLKPGTELRLEDADLPIKPHSDVDRPGNQRDTAD